MAYFPPLLLPGNLTALDLIFNVCLIRMLPVQPLLLAQFIPVERGWKLSKDAYPYEVTLKRKRRNKGRQEGNDFCFS
jgi:hypothetical protein